jgi:hypothetical protein
MAGSFLLVDGGRPSWASGTDQLEKRAFLQGTMAAYFTIQLTATETTCERVMSTLAVLFRMFTSQARDDLTLAQSTMRFHELWDNPQ